MLGSIGYRRSPVWAQELLIAANSSVRSALREGRAFAAAAAEISGSQWWSADELFDFQMLQLRALLQTAGRDVPWYRERFRALGLNPASLALPRDLAKLPLLDKREVRAAGAELISTARRGPLFSGSTSGTTGSPLHLHQDLAAIARENAFIWRQLEWAGLHRGARRAWLRGDMIVPATQREPPYWRMDRADNMLMLSSYHLSAASVPAYLAALERFDPVLIQAYPSSIGFLAAWMRDAGRRYRAPALRGIVTSSETLTAEARREIAAAFGCRVYDWYGQFERVAAIGTCEQGRLHLLTDYSYVELLPAGEGLFELVGTGFGNLAQPLIRYRCGDLVRLAPPGERCACGRAFPLVEQVLGRVDDAVKLPDGRSVGRLDHIFKGVNGILEAQLRQDRLDAVEILVVPAPDFNARERDTVLANARERLGEEVAIELRCVERIARGAQGKFKGVVCNL
ncbi:MAG TPA: phenylacetate--CoA ligase family protein [Burkholderiales bacterium]